MTERKEFTPYGYNPYQQQPQGQPSLAAQQERANMQMREPGLMDRVFGAGLAAKLRTPMVATVALLTVGVAFAAVVAISYPSGDDAQNIPVITADVSGFKVAPGEEGGVTLAHQDSTVFDVMSSDAGRVNPFENGRPVENLLEPQEPVEEAVDTLEAFAAEAKEAADAAREAAVAAENAVEAIEPAAGDDVSVSAETATNKGNRVESLLVLPEDAEKAVPAAADEILKKVEPQEVAKVTQSVEKVAPQDLAKTTTATSAEAPTTGLHPAGSSPDTIAFVRSVLDQKDTKGANTGGTSAKVAAQQAANLAAVEPAAGGDAINAPSRVAVSAGTYYVQLASVTSRAGAASEWTKMEKSLPINGLEYRVQEANLGERGTFYRIQAGPMSKDSANALCDSIKAEKPGGCLVVK